MPFVTVDAGDTGADPGPDTGRSSQRGGGGRSLGFDVPQITMSPDTPRHMNSPPGSVNAAEPLKVLSGLQASLSASSGANRRRSTIRRPTLPSAGKSMTARSVSQRMFRASNPPSRRGSLDSDGHGSVQSGTGGAPAKGPIQATQQHPTSLPQELLNVIQAFRVAVEHVAANPSTSPDTSRELHQTSNDLIRYVSGFLIMKYAEEAAQEERKSTGWRNMALGVTNEAMKASASAMGPLALQALYAIMDSLLSLCHCDRGTLFLLDERTEELTSVVTVGAGAVIKPIRVRPTSGVVGSVFTTGLAVNVLSTERVPPTIFDRATDKQTGYYTRSILAAPLIRTASTEDTAGVTPQQQQEGRVQQSKEKPAGPALPLPSPTLVDGSESSSPTKNSKTLVDANLEKNRMGNKGSILGVVQLLNKAHHLSNGEFDEHDEIVLHHATKIMTSIVQWTSYADLAGSASLELSMHLQSQLIAYRQRPEAERTMTTSGSKEVTITEAKMAFQRQLQKEVQMSEKLKDKDFFTAKDGAPSAAHRANAVRRGEDAVPNSVLALGRRIEVGSTLVYRVGAKQYRVGGGESTGGSSVGGTKEEGPQRDVRDVALFLARIEESWKAAREKCQKQEEVIQSLRLGLFEERKRWRVLHNLCLKCGLVSSESSGADVQDSFLEPDENVDDTEFLNRLNMNEDRIRTQQSLVSTQDVAFQVQRQKIASQPLQQSAVEIVAQRKAADLAAMRNPSSFSKASAGDIQAKARNLIKKIDNEPKNTLNAHQLAAREKIAATKKKRIEAVSQRLAALVARHNVEREAMLDRHREETEKLYADILVEDREFEEALALLVAQPGPGNPTPSMTHSGKVESLCDPKRGVSVSD